MPISRQYYFNTLGFLPRNGRRKAALDRAYQQRSFEIEHYWKRATYFWGFQIAIFAALGLIWSNENDSPSIVTLALSLLGVLTALASWLSALGSKFWQQNWEYHIDMLEDQVEGRLYKTVWLSAWGFSVSKINRALAACFTAFWLFVAVYVAADLLDYTWFDSENASNLVAPMLGIAAAGFGWICFQWSSLRGTIPLQNGSHGAPRGRLRGRHFMRRYAPDEFLAD